MDEQGETTIITALRFLAFLVFVGAMVLCIVARHISAGFETLAPTWIGGLVAGLTAFLGADLGHGVWGHKDSPQDKGQ